mgnify:CR=1 FL=1
MSKGEKIVSFFSVLGVIIAIVFTSFQLYFSRKDFELQTRPYLKVEPNLSLLSEINILGISIKKDNYFLYYYFEKDKQALLQFPISVKNIGKSPAFIKKIKTVIIGNNGSLQVIFEEPVVDILIYPDENILYNIDKNIVKDDYEKKSVKSSNNQIITFNEIYGDLNKNFQSGDFICELRLYYSRYDVKHSQYILTKSWVITNKGKKALIKEQYLD